LAIKTQKEFANVSALISMPNDWFAMVNVVTIVLMIAGGGLMIIFGFGNHGSATAISNLWSHGGFMPNGPKGVLTAMQMVMFAYLGVEMIGLTAGEADNPKKSIPDAINSVFWRILLFYVGALFVILSIYPWNELRTHGSPFEITFQRLGIKSAAGIINFVVLTAALSSCNGGIYSTAACSTIFPSKATRRECSLSSREGAHRIARFGYRSTLSCSVYCSII
jgi:amino acid transporter, AAT family